MVMFKGVSFLFVLCFEMHGIIAANENSSFLFNGFGNFPILEKDIALFGDSKLYTNSSSIQLTNSVSRSEGRVVYRKPIKLLQGKERNQRSFSTYFSFSMPNEIDNVFTFVMVPSSLDLNLFGMKDNTSSGLGFLLQYAKNETVLAVEFDVSKRGNRARILIGRPESAKIRQLSFVGDLIMNNGGTLSCMIEYDANVKRMLVRFRKSGSIKLFDPFFSFLVDLSKLWKDGEITLGLSSVNGNSSKSHFLHSWGFKIIHPPPMWMHSEPLEPNEALKADIFTDEEEDSGRSECSIWRMVGALVLGVVFGTLWVMLGLYLWMICGVKRSMVVVPEECVVAVEEGKK